MAAVEAAAALRFNEIGMTHIASSPPTALDDLLERVVAGRALVAVDTAGAIAGFAIYRMLDAQRLYLEEVDVSPACAGQRIGAALIEAVAARGRAAGATQIVLSTFRQAPWNAPYYRRLGFADLGGDALDPVLAGVRAMHVERGLDETQRVFMSRALDRGVDGTPAVHAGGR
ncbi:GNAT family N-acetyltransferase [Burkholderia alba]|uniref:GNAT family N-acetyltransferase n=1 Tax=Burkholderia alba TaxID=2683677 RepID=UPI0038993DBE